MADGKQYSFLLALGGRGPRPVRHAPSSQGCSTSHVRASKCSESYDSFERGGHGTARGLFMELNCDSFLHPEV